MFFETLKATADLRLVARYVPGNPHYRTDAPTLATSLAVFGVCAEFQAFVASRGASVACLVQGYTAPVNAQALRAALLAPTVLRSRIVAVDQIPLPEIYSQLGVEMPEIDFVQANACDLGDRLGGDTFDLVVQDFILNCLCPANAAALLAEARRHLKPDGLCLISFSADAEAPTHATVFASALAPSLPRAWTPQSAGLFDLAQTESDYFALETLLQGKSILDADSGTITQVTAPSGQFEFFVSKQKIIDLIEAAGFAVSVVDATEAVDYSGLRCTRYRVIATPV